MSTTLNMDQKAGMKLPPTQEEEQQVVVAGLQKCPRCESTNTKFCYFNNYSLTQPRHFCKACKRYWTKGGTLRNVPVGGGCRKNKRVKRPSTTTTSSSSSLPILHNIDPHTFSTKSTSNPMFYGLPVTNNNPSNDHLNTLPFHDYDLDRHHQHQALGGLGLGFSTSGVALNDDYRNGFAPNPLLSNYGSMFESSSPSTATTNPTSMASIIASSLQPQQKFMQQGEGEGINGASDYHFKSLFPFENMQIANNNGESGGEINGVKVEGGQLNMYNWSDGTSSVVVPNSHDHQSDHDPIQQIGSSSDHNNPSLYTWNNNTTNWPDLTNIGSSVTSSLI